MTRGSLLLATLVIASAAAVGQAQTNPTPAPSPTPTPTATPAVTATAKASSTPTESYEALLAKAKAGDRTVDFTALRLAFYASPNYNPDTPMMTYRPLYGALGQGNLPEAIKIADSVLAKNFVEVNAHIVAYIAHRDSGNKERADFHKFIADGLLDSIQSKGDGNSAETAYQVISINEEYGLMRMLGVRPIKQQLIKDKGHFVDAVTIVKGDQQGVMYFNVDKVFAWREKQ